MSNIVQLYITQVFSTKVTTSYRYCKRMVSFNPSPEWDIMTTSVALVLSNLINSSLQYKDSLCHSCSTCHFLLKCTYTVWILSGNVPPKSLQVIDIVNVWFLLTHLQNGILWQLPQCISNSLEIKQNLCVLSNLINSSLQYKDSLCHSCSTCHFLLKCTYTVWILSGNVHMSYMYRFYLYIYCYLTINLLN
jgi:hypothetical protein